VRAVLPKRLPLMRRTISNPLICPRMVSGEWSVMMALTESSAALLDPTKPPSA
jgi:hypothetical protein